MKNMRKYVGLAILITLLLPAYSFAVARVGASGTPGGIARTAAPPETKTVQTVQTVSTSKDIYIAQSGSTTAEGSSCSSALPVSWLNTSSNWLGGIKSVKAGDTVHLCGVISQKVMILGSGVSGSPITIKFEPGAKLSSEAWDASYGALYANNRQYIIVDGAGGGKIENTANGTALSKQVGSVGLLFNNCQNSEVKNLIVSNLYQRTPGSSDSKTVGLAIILQGDSSNSSVHDCVVEDAWKGINVAYYGVKSSNVAVYNNSISKTAVGISIGSGSTGAKTGNISVYNNKIFDNYVYDGPGWTPPPGDGHHHADGIHVFAVHTDSSLNGLNIYNNDIGPNLGTTVTAWIYIEGTGISNVNIYNNVLTASGSSYAATGYIGLQRTVGVNNVYNNTIVGSGRGNGLYLWGGTTGVNVRNNIFSKVSTGIGVDKTSTINSSNRNAYYGLGSNQMYYQTKFYTVANWQSALGFDKDGVVADPVLSTTHLPTSNSPVRGKGENLRGIFVKDKAGVTRPSTGWTMGAYQ